MRSLLCFILIYGAFLAVRPVLSADRELVRIGVVAPLTGTMANWAADVVRFNTRIAEYFSARSSRFRYQFVLEDGQCGVGNAAITAGHKLITTERIKFLLVACSGELLQIAPLAERAGVVLIGFAASHPDARNAGDFIFRTYVDMERAMQPLIQSISGDGRERVAILSEEASFTQGIKKIITAGLGDRVKVNDDFQVAETDFRALLLRTLGQRPDAFYLNTGSPKTYILLYRQLRELNATVPVYAYQNPGERESIEVLGSSQEGVRFIGTPSLAGGNKSYNDLLAQYRSEFKEDPSVDFLLRTFLSAMEALMLALEAVGAEAAHVKDNLYTLDFEGATGRVRFDAAGDIRDLHLVMKSIKEGRVVE